MKRSDIDKSRVLQKNMRCRKCNGGINMKLHVNKVGEVEWIDKWRIECRCTGVEVSLGPDDFLDPYQFATEVSYERRPDCWPPLVENDEGLNWDDHGGRSGL